MPPTTTTETLKAELARLSSETLSYIDYCQYELTGKRISEVIDSIMWDRWSTAGGAWPTSAPIADDELGRPYKFQTVTYCGKASSPDDPAHQVARSLMLEINGVTYDGVICSCGDRLSGPARRRRLHPRGASNLANYVWPMVTIDRVPYFVVCKAAQTPFDLDHGPLWIMESCICGAAFPEKPLYGAGFHPSPAKVTNTDRSDLERHFKLWDAQ